MYGIYFIILTYFVLNFFMLFRVYRFLRATPVIAVALFVVGGLFSGGYLLGRILHGHVPAAVSGFISLAGSFWMVAFIYFLMIWIIFEVGRLVLKSTGHLESNTRKLPKAFPQIAVGAILIFVTALIAAGYQNNLRAVVHTHSIRIDKMISDNQSLRILIAADMHLGTIVDGKRAEQIVQKINEQNPDIVFLPGDIIDIDTQEVIANGGAAALGKIKAPLGVYACLGNHEVYAGEEASTRLLSDLGIIVLRDEFVNLSNGLQIAGRLDYAREGFGLTRKSISEILKDASPMMPILLLDHQPRALKEAQEAGVDLIVCGHTHNGQFWPINYVVRMIFDLAYGYARWGNTHIYVSNGVGSWGPPVRIGRPPEIVVIDVEFHPPLSKDQKLDR